MHTTDDAPPTVERPAIAPGTIVAGRYRLESRLGAGGGGAVWRCHDTKLDAIVALKIIDADIDLERWRREVAMARKIADRNVCRVHDLGETPELRFVTMELVEGTNLRAKVRADLPEAEARDLVRQVVSGTAAIHAAGVVHRDLKPENIVVDANGRAVIVDFGLARPSEAATVDIRTPKSSIVGTPRYMSPEQAMGEGVDARTDVWALGLIAHELLTGELPKQTIELPKWPAAEAAVRKCLSRAPAERFADARQLLAALSRRRRTWIAIPAVAAVAAAGAVFVATRTTKHEEPPSTDGVRVVQVTNTEKEWPMDAPVSVAISPDATRFAYTTAHGELRVRSLAGTDTKAWTLPVILKPMPDPTAAPRKESLVSTWVVGWYSDGSLAVLGTLRSNEWQLHRVREDGSSELLHAATQRFPAAIANDRVIVAKPGAIFRVLPNDQLEQVAPVVGRVFALAISPDGKRIASVRDDGIYVDDNRVYKKTPDALVDETLVWLDDRRVAFADAGHLVVLGDKAVATRVDGEFFGVASAAHGTVLVIRGSANESVQIGEKSGWPMQRVHDGRGTALAGWIDNAVVFAHGPPGKERIVRASLAGGVEPWPNTTPGVEVPDAVVDHSVIAHRADGNQTVVERIDPDGKHVELQRRVSPVSVRCAGEHAAPCVLEVREVNRASWVLIDPQTGKLGDSFYRRDAGPARSAALSADGKLLAVVEGTADVHLVSTTDASLKTVTVRDAIALQSIAFAPNNDLWTTSVGFDGRWFGLARYTWYDKGQKIFDSAALNLYDKRSLLRWCYRATPSADTQHVAMVVRELHLEVSRIDGL